MKPLRLILITRRFWPLVGGGERVAADLATQFAIQGARPTILTACWDPTWPVELVHRDVPVVRLPNPPLRGWGTWRYMANLARWLRGHRGQIDLVYVWMLKHDAHAAIGALCRTDVPIVLRAGSSGDCQWQAQANFGRRIRRRCWRADALVAPTGRIAAELEEAGYPKDRIHQIANGVPIGPPRSEANRAAAREALANVNQDLALPKHAPLVVFTGRLHEAKGLEQLVAAFQPILARWPNAKLWLVGEGPQRAALEKETKQAELHRRVLLPGAFDSVEQVLQAADLFVLPSREEGMSLALLEAMAMGLPIVASDIPGNRGLVADARHALLHPVGDIEGLSAAMFRLLDQPDLAAQLGAAARDRAEKHFSIGRAVQKHQELFDRLLDGNV